MLYSTRNSFTYINSQLSNIEVIIALLVTNNHFNTNDYQSKIIKWY